MNADAVNTNRLIWWKVRCIRSADKTFFDRLLVLDESKLADNQKTLLEEILPHTRKHIGFARMRAAFYEIRPEELKRICEDRNPIHGVCVDPYFEDESGTSFDEIGLAKILSGEENPILRGNAKSVLRLGPTPMADVKDWTQEKTNNIAHFLHLVIDLSRSDWMNHPLTIGMQGDNIIDFDHPGLYKTKNVLLYMRQLLLKQDDVVNVAGEAYLAHIAHDGKAAWMKAMLEDFNAARSSASFPRFVEGYTAEQVIDMVTYGSGAAHRKSRDKWEDKLPSIVAKHGQEQLVFSFHLACKTLLAYASNVAAVIQQDFNYWVKTEGHLGPNRVSFGDLFNI